MSGYISQDRPHHLCRIGIGLWSELLHSAAKTVCDIQVALLVGRQSVRTVQPAWDSPLWLKCLPLSALRNQPATAGREGFCH